MAQKRRESGRAKGAGVVSSSKGSKKGFYVVIGIAAVAGIAALSYFSSLTKANKVIVLDPNLPAVTSQGYVMGSPTAPIEIIEFGDFECPACQKFAAVTEPDLRTQYVNTGKIRFRFIDYPLPMHRNSLNASTAAACADEQGKFWEMHDLIFDTQHEWNGQATNNPDKHLKELGGRIPGLDRAKLAECIDSRRTLPKVQAHLKIATERQVPSTPTFVIGSKQLNIIAIDDFKRVIEQETAARDQEPKSTKKP